MVRFTAFVRRELTELALPTLTFFVAFEVVVLARSWVGTHQALEVRSTSSAALAALILGKSILIADHTPMLRWFRRPRMIVNVIWRASLYLCMAALFQLLEYLIRHRAAGLEGAFADLSRDFRWPRFMAMHLVLGMILCCYSFATAMIEHIGWPRFREHFLGSSPPAGGAGPGAGSD